MTFDELEVGRLYWFKYDGRTDCGRLVRNERINALVLAADDVYYEEHEVTDITPVPTSEEYLELVGLLRDAYDVLRRQGKWYVGDGRHSASLDEKIESILQKVEGK